MPHLAQVNVARLLAPLDTAPMQGFVAAIAAIDRLAAASPGFLWKYGGEGGHGVSVQPAEGGPVFVNLSLWTDYDALHQFVYRTAHTGYLRHRSRWFAATPQPSTALWWVAPGARPTVEDALRRLRFLRDHGPTPRVFSLRRRFQPDGRPVPRSGPTAAGAPRRVGRSQRA